MNYLYISLALLALLILALLLWIVYLRRNLKWKPATRQQRDLALHVRLSGTTGPATVLLHGLAGSGRYFGAQFDALAEGGRVVVPDLLGFGQSPKPDDIAYTVEDHVSALVDTLDALQLEGPSLIAGHSTGCLIALALAKRRPDLVSAIVAFSPPYYDDAESARTQIGKISQIVKMFAMDTPVAQATCHLMCKHRETARLLTPLLRPDLPVPIARDGVDHIWKSYSGTLKEVILQGHASVWATDSAVPLKLIAGEHDDVVVLSVLKRCAEANPLVSLEVWDDDHDLPLHQPERCVQVLMDQRDAVAQP